MDIKVDIESSEGLVESLDKSSGIEIVDQKEELWRCDKCGNKVSYIRQIRYSHLPNTLFFHLKRFRFDSGKGTKINKKFTFPVEEFLDMTNYTKEFPEYENEENIYSYLKNVKEDEMKAEKERMEELFQEQRKKKLKEIELLSELEPKVSTDFQEQETQTPPNKSLCSLSPSNTFLSPEPKPPLQSNEDPLKSVSRSPSSHPFYSVSYTPIVRHSIISEISKKSNLYRLVGIIVHKGELNNGHFKSYIRERKPPYSWYEFDDRVVRFGFFFF